MRSGDRAMPSHAWKAVPPCGPCPEPGRKLCRAETRPSLGFCGTVQERKREDALGLAGSGCQGSAGSQDCWDGRPQMPQQEGVRPFGPWLRQKADIWAPEECSKVVDICWFHTSLL